MVSKAPDAAVWEDGKEIRTAMYYGIPLNLNRLLVKLDDWKMTVTEDMDPGTAEKYVFKWFGWRLPVVLQELYFVPPKGGKITTLKEPKGGLNGQERVDAPQGAAKRWRAMKPQHDGREIRVPDWRDFRGHYILFRRNMEDLNEGDEQSGLCKLPPQSLAKQVTKEKGKRAKSNHTVNMMLNKEHHKEVVSWTRSKVVRDFKRQSLWNALLIAVAGGRTKAAI